MRRWLRRAIVATLVAPFVLAACGSTTIDADRDAERGVDTATVAPGGSAPTLPPPPTGPTTTFSPPTAPPPTMSLPSLPSAPTAPPGFLVETTVATTVPLPAPVTLPDTTHLRTLASPSQQDHVPASANSFCAELATPGWFLEQCEVVGVVFVTVQRSTADNHLRVQVLSDAATPGAWRAILSAEDLMNRWQEAVVLAADTDGDGVPEIWVGYRTSTGDLDVDIVVVRRDGSMRRVADHGLRSGRTVVVPGGADTYEPVFLAGDLGCCPTGGADRREVRVEGANWVATRLPPLPPGSPVPFSSFDAIMSD